MRFERIQDRTKGRWRHLLPAIGIPERFLSNKHGPCPMCEGTDRFRWDDKNGSGSFYCSKCGAGSGVDLVMCFKGVPFIDAKRIIEEHLPDAAIVAPKAARTPNMDLLAERWQAARRLTGDDPASLYLARRGLVFDVPPVCLRWMENYPYHHDDKAITKHPVMLALFVGPDRSSHTIQYTYLDGAGGKADVPTPRKLHPAKVPNGGAVRLAASAETMGVAEGVETALAAMKTFEIPVWATLSTTSLMKWEPPPTAKHVIVFGDNDRGFAGQLAAYNLAHTLALKTYCVEVRIPKEPGTDWNDMIEVGHEQAQ
jgi:putative DNA primase/helicase